MRKTPSKNCIGGRVSAVGKASFESVRALAIGVFDGVHLGHRRVVEKAVAVAKKLGGNAGVMSFFPHPSKVTKTREVKLVSSIDERVCQIESIGANFVYIKRFDKPFSQKTPEQFVEFLKRMFPNLKAVVTGENFHFGRGAKGSAEWFKANAAAYGLRYFCVGAKMAGGERISSSRLREVIQAGNMAEDNRLCARAYKACGKIEGGMRLGRKLGFPTLNLSFNPECRPPFGVYLVKLKAEGGDGFESFGVANYGVKPSVGLTKIPLLETNLFKTPPFGAGRRVCVEFIKFIRHEEKFSSLEALKAQIAKDKAEALRLSKKIRVR